MGIGFGGCGQEDRYIRASKYNSSGVRRLRLAPISTIFPEVDLKLAEIIADNLRKAGWSCCCVPVLDYARRLTWMSMRTAATENVTLCVLSLAKN
jgi:hypothetical protein